MKFDDVFYLHYGLDKQYINKKDYFLLIKKIVVNMQDLFYLFNWCRSPKPRLFFPIQNIKIKVVEEKLEANFEIFTKYHKSRWTACWSKNLEEIYYNKDEQALVRKRDEIAKWLNKMRIEAVILLNDLHPLERLVIEGAKKIGIPSICIQHGFLASVKEQKNRLGLGKYADYFLTWGEWTKKDYKKYDFKSESRMISMGYPFYIKKVGNLYNKSLLFIGMGVIDPGLKESIICLAKLCEQKGFKMGYKPHPRGIEDDLDCLIVENICIVENYGDMTELVFEEWDIICAVASSMLVEAYLADKPCFQFIGEWEEWEDFEKIKICPRYTLENVGNYLDMYLENRELKYPQVSEYVYLNEDYAGDLCKFLNKII